jgi:excisionase family DNA binding protein
MTTSIAAERPTQWPTIQQAAETLQTSTKTIRRRIADGTLDARRIGPRLIRVNPTSLAALGTPLQYREAE